MSFNVDDPLAGILSDGSEDSFFDDDILGKKKTVKKKSTPNIERKSKLFNLNDLTAKEKSKKIEPNDIAATVSKPYIKPDQSQTKTPDSYVTNSSFAFKNIDNFKNINSSEVKDVPLNKKAENKNSPFKVKAERNNEKKDFDFLDELVGPKKADAPPLEQVKDSQSLLDDILGNPTKKVSQINKQNPKKQQYNLDKTKGIADPKETLALKKPKDQSETLNKNEQIKTKASEDWLGIFQDESETLEEAGTEVPSWLGGGNSVKKKSMEKDKKSITTKEVENETLNPATLKDDERTKEISETENYKILKSSENLQYTKNICPDPDQLHKNDNDVTMQGAALYLQQQEAQLMVAMQLKAQDEKLAAMQLKQKETQRVQRGAALAQHAQLDAMLQRQANNRMQMQAIINAHQDRITRRIKALLESNNTELDEVKETRNDDESAEKTNEDSPLNKEKRQLLQLLQSLQENHDKEIDILETSYRRQLAFLEISLSQTEERMRDESEKQIKFYTEKINWLEEHHQLYKKWTEEHTTSLIERHNAEKDMLRQQHSENVKGLQEHHSTLMENIKNAVKQEHVLVRDSAGFATDIHELLADVKESKSSCQQLVDKVTKMTSSTQDEAERIMKARERQIDDMIEQLKKDRDYFEREKAESKEIIHTLEQRLKQMTTMLDEESASLKQKKMEFEFEKATFNKQTEFAKNVLKKQHDEVKMIKDDIEKEYQEKVTKINDENSRVLKEAAIVAKEKASIQSLKMELEKTKAELQGQLEEMSEERSKLSLEKNELRMEEQRVLSKGREIEQLTKTAMEKQSQAERKSAEADSVQRKYEDGMRRLQEHVLSLNAREKEIAREKIVLSRERISLHNDRKRMESEQKCSLCRSIPRAQYPEYLHTYETPASRDYGDANVSRALSSIELEMAHLVGRSLGLRHETASAGASERPLGGVSGTGGADVVPDTGGFKDYMDPKFMMLRLDVQKVIHNLGDKDASLDRN